MTKLGVLCKSPQALEKYYWIPTRWIYQNSQNIHAYDNVYIYNVFNHLHIYIYMLYVASYPKTNRPKKNWKQSFTFPFPFRNSVWVRRRNIHADSRTVFSTFFHASGRRPSPTGFVQLAILTITFCAKISDTFYV